MRFNLLAATLALLPAVFAAPADPAPASTQASVKALSRAYLVNCYTDPVDGTRSEVNFFKQAPLKTFGHATPNYISVVSDGINEVWENNGGSTSTAVGSTSATFAWTINYTEDSISSVPPGFEVGTATLSTGQKFALFKGDLELLRTEGTDPTFSCKSINSAFHDLLLIISQAALSTQLSRPTDSRSHIRLSYPFNPEPRFVLAQDFPVRRSMYNKSR